ncbi:hypothetical protein L218DRAFT_840998, partial [Marasmius fiardii PR-910]
RVDIFDDPNCKEIIATFELPGVTVHDMNVDILDGKLVVEGTRQMKDNMHVDGETDEPVPRIVTAELRYGRFRRDTIQLPNGVQKSDVTASLQNGMLKVTWPRQP